MRGLPFDRDGFAKVESFGSSGAGDYRYFVLAFIISRQIASYSAAKMILLTPPFGDDAMRSTYVMTSRSLDC